MVTWTPADDAELDVLVHALVRGYWDQHRDRCEACRTEPCPELEAWNAHKTACRACQGDAPLTFGAPCDRRRVFLDHGSACKRCNPCPHLQTAIAAVVDWRDARALLSRAQALRAEVGAQVS